MQSAGGVQRGVGVRDAQRPPPRLLAALEAKAEWFVALCLAREDAQALEHALGGGALGKPCPRLVAAVEASAAAVVRACEAERTPKGRRAVAWSLQALNVTAPELVLAARRWKPVVAGGPYDRACGAASTHNNAHSNAHSMKRGVGPDLQRVQTALVRPNWSTPDPSAVAVEAETTPPPAAPPPDDAPARPIRV